MVVVTEEPEVTEEALPEVTVGVEQEVEQEAEQVVSTRHCGFILHREKNYYLENAMNCLMCPIYNGTECYHLEHSPRP